MAGSNHHRHRPATITILPFGGAVSFDQQGFYARNPQADGGYLEWAACQCGAVRLTNHNQGWVERGRWQAPTPSIPPSDVVT